MQKITAHDLNSELLNSIKLLQSGEIDVEAAKAISQLAQVMVNVAKVEVDFIRVTDGFGTGFFPEMEVEGRREPKRIGGQNQYSLVPADPFEGVKAKTQKAILDYLLENGGESRIGAMMSDGGRHVTIRHLEVLEEKGLIVCVERPVNLKPGTEYKTQPDEVLNYCGVWKLAKMPDTSLKLVSTKKTA